MDEGYEDVSPYNAMNDAPIRYSDPLGDGGEEANVCCDVAGALNILRNTQIVAAVTEVVGGGPENSVAYAVVAVEEVVGGIWALGQFVFGNNIPAVPKTIPKAPDAPINTFPLAAQAKAQDNKANVKTIQSQQATK